MEEMTQNMVARHLSAEEWAAVDLAITALTTALEPALVALAPDRRKRVVKMGDGSEAFCRLSLDVMTENAGLMPRDFALDEMRRDLASHDALNARMVRLSTLMEKVNDTDTALGSDVMAAALEGYSFLKTAGKGEGVEALRKLLGKRFDNNSRRGGAEPVPAPVPAPA
jgi:hypothetical protein